MSDLTGQSLGPYTITERIGRGGMAEVYKALHTGLSVHRALKVIRPELVTADDFRVRFQKEAQAVAQLRHPNIVQVHDFGSHNGAYYMVMEFIEGRDLKRVLASEGRIRPIRRAVELIDRVASALEYAHGRGLIHRDIKPENVMVTASGDPILTDFGIAKLVTSSVQLTQTGFGIGTPAYMAPEQAQGLTEVGPQADIYALMVVLFELLTGRVPYNADTPIAVIMKAMNDPMPMPRTLQPDISERLQTVILKGTQKRPEDRYSTVSELRRALAATLRGADDSDTLPASTLVNDATTVVAAPRLTSMRVVGGGVAAAALLAAGALWYLQTPSSPVAPSVAEPAAAPVQIPVAESATAPSPPAPQPSPVAAEPTALELDTPVTVTPGASATYAFEGTAGDTLYFDRVDDATARFALAAPDATRILDAAGDTGPFELKQSGRYLLTATVDGDASAAFVLRRLDRPMIDLGSVVLNDAISGGTTLPGQTTRYSIALKAGQRVRLVVDRVTAPADFRLASADGTHALFATDHDTGLVDVPAAGDYSLTVDPRGDAVAQYAFTLRSPLPKRSPDAVRPRSDAMAQVPSPPREAPAQSTQLSRTVPGELPTSSPPEVATLESPPAAAPGTTTPGNKVVKGVTTQRDLLRLFGGPNLTTVNEAGLETWIYERTLTQTDSTSANRSGAAGVDFAAFFDVIKGTASASVARANDSASSRSAIRSVTVIVTFAPNRTVSDYTVTENTFQ